MRAMVGVTLILVFSLVRLGASQQPIASLAIGGGDGYGVGAGVRGEVFLAQGRLSVLAGAGVLPWEPYRSRVNYSGSLRYYYRTDASPHRFYVEGSWSVVSTWSIDGTCMVLTWEPIPQCARSPEHFDYGPGISLGYARMSTSGLTFSVGAGVGRSVLSDLALTRPMLQLGIGWTWRQRRS